MSIFYVSGTVLSAGDAALMRQANTPALGELPLYRRRKTKEMNKLYGQSDGGKC